MYDDRDSSSDSRRKPGEPHPDWQRNRDYIQSQLESSVIQGKLNNAKSSTRWDGVRPVGERQIPDPSDNRFLTTEKVYEVLTTFVISWESNGDKFGHPFSLHQDTNQLIEEWERFFGLKGGPLSKRGVYTPPQRR